MSHKYLDIAFTPEVQAVQTEKGSRLAYSRHEAGPDVAHELTEREKLFIAERDSVYMATVNSDGWPYIQHRGGAPGFMKVLDDSTIGFADFRGNRQYVTVGNLTSNERVSLFFMDYPNRRRLKMFGLAETIDAEDSRMAKLQDVGYKAKVERGMLITVLGFDWNCPQHITPRFSEREIQAMMAEG